MFLDNASIIFPKEENVKVLLSRSGHATKIIFLKDDTLFTASLISFFQGESFQQLLAQSEPCETLVDAVEHLHDQTAADLGDRLGRFYDHIVIAHPLTRRIASLKVGDIIEDPRQRSTGRIDVRDVEGRSRGSGRGNADEPVKNALSSDEDVDRGCFPPS